MRDINTHAVFAQTERGSLVQVSAPMPYGSALRRHANVVDALPADHQTVVLPAAYLQEANGFHQKVVALAVRAVDEVAQTHYGSVVREDRFLAVYTAQVFTEDDAPEVALADQQGTEVIWSGGGYRIRQATVRLTFAR